MGIVDVRTNICRVFSDMLELLAAGNDNMGVEFENEFIGYRSSSYDHSMICVSMFEVECVVWRIH